MPKIAIFREESTLKLEKRVNDFIGNKNVVNVSYSVAECGYGYLHCCCILYEG